MYKRHVYSQDAPLCPPLFFSRPFFSRLLLALDVKPEARMRSSCRMPVESVEVNPDARIGCRFASPVKPEANIFEPTPAVRLARPAVKVEARICGSIPAVKPEVQMRSLLPAPAGSAARARQHGQHLFISIHLLMH